MPPSPPLQHAPGILGAFALALIATLPGCREEARIPEWQGKTVAEELHNGPPAAAESEPSAHPVSTRAPGNGLRFLTYNVENWLTTDRDPDRQPNARTPAKPESERAAVVDMILSARPDVVGISEIGGADELDELRLRLRDSGLDLPHADTARGADEVRRLGLLSRFPILASADHENLNYQIDGRRMGMSRGILDTTLDTPLGPVRLLGVHLKSKREIPEADQELMRREEAHLLRRQADRVLSTTPGGPLIVYGDFNDTRQSPTLKILLGPRDVPTSLTMVRAHDSRGEYWTHHWSYHDVYSRFDYVLVGQALIGRIDRRESRVLDDPRWSEASDHRPVLVVFD